MKKRKILYFSFFLLFIGFIAVSSWHFISRGAEIPATVTAIPPFVILTQNSYRWHANENNLTPAQSLAAENTATATPAAGTALRLRINLTDSLLELSPGASFKLQYSNNTSTGWIDLGSTAAWGFFANPGVADGQTIMDLVLSGSDAGETYNESNPSADTPTAVSISQDGEWDWAINNNSAATNSNWYFRMVYASSTLLDTYTRFPALTPAPPAPPPPAGGGVVGVPAGPTPSPPPEVRPPLFPPQPPFPTLPEKILKTTDLNGDERVDIIDLSILLYFYNRTGADIWRYDLNDDVTVNFLDVSVMMYYWTG